MTYGSLFTGAGGADLGLHRAGMKPLWFCEVDRQCQDVLRYRWPDVTCYPDVTTFPAEDVPCPDVLWMSPPCQDLSVAGKRAGLAGGRSGLFYAAVGIAKSLRGRGLRWVLMEQVPGLFSSNAGGDFREVLHELRQLGVSVGWRVLDSQWFGVPQRRKRVYFAVDCRDRSAFRALSDAEVLPVRAEADSGEREARHPSASHRGPYAPWIGGTLNARSPRRDGADGATWLIPVMTDSGWAIRDASPLEEERGQGWPDEHTRWGRKEDGTVYEMADGPRYRMAGNGVTSTVSAWIGERVMAQEGEGN